MPVCCERHGESAGVLMREAQRRGAYGLWEGRSSSLNAGMGRGGPKWHRLEAASLEEEELHVALLLIYFAELRSFV